MKKFDERLLKIYLICINLYIFLNDNNYLKYFLIYINKYFF